MAAGIGALLSGVGSIAGAWSGAEAQSETNKQNQMVNIINWYMQMQARADAIKEAERGRTMAFEGTTDAQGNRVRYVPGKGWVTEASLEGKGIQDMQNREQVRVLAQDLPARREQMFTNLKRQAGEEDVAGQIMKELQRVKIDPTRLQQEMEAGTTKGINADYDALVSSVARNATRTGSSNFGNILKKLNQERAKTSGQAMGQIPSQARAQAAQLEQSQKGQLANLYNMFATRAGAMPGVSYAPQNIQGQANAMLGPNAARGQNAQNTMMSAVGRQPALFDYLQPDDYAAKAMTTTGAALGNIADAFTGQREKDILYKNFAQRYSAGGGMV